MALDQSALSELLDALRAGGDLDVVREGLALVLQALIEAEAAQQIGAGRYERSAARTTNRNGSRGRLLSTKAGDVELKIPKLREGSFFPALLEPRRRIDRALLAVVVEAYVHRTAPPPAGSTPWSSPWAWMLASPSPRSPGSAPSWTERSPPSDPGRWLIPPSRTCSWMPPTSRPGWTAAWSLARWGSPPGSPPTAAGKSWAWMWAIARTARSGRRSCARSKQEGWPGCSWSSRTPIPASGQPSARSWLAPAGSDAESPSCATSWPGCPGARPRWWLRPS